MLAAERAGGLATKRYASAQFVRSRIVGGS